VVRATVTPLEDGFCHVSITADISGARNGVMGGSVAMAGIGLEGVQWRNYFNALVAQSFVGFAGYFIFGGTRLLFSGDFLLPGRLLVDDIEAYEASALRVIEAVNAHGVQFALGAHIEMAASGELYSGGSSFHPDERALPLPFDSERAVALRQALQDFNGFYSRHPDYAVVNPIHNLIALAIGVIAALVLLVWIERRLWKRHRVTRAAV